MERMIPEIINNTQDSLDSMSIAKKPLVSIVVPNYNNGIYLKHALGSLTDQTLRDIEIIIIDDGSNDASVSIIADAAANDNRIVFMNNVVNSGAHNCRMQGVAKARGRYIMFMDSDDYIHPQACETALREIENGYDVVCFNLHVLESECGDNINEWSFSKFYNHNKENIYNGIDVISAIFEHRDISVMLVDKIFDATLCKRAFARLKGVSLRAGEHVYELMAIAKLANSIKTITDKLYFWNRRHMLDGHEVESHEIATAFDACQVWTNIEIFMKENGLNELKSCMSACFLQRAINPILKYNLGCGLRKYVNNIMDCFGLINLMNYLVDVHFYDFEAIANGFAACTPALANDYKARNIAMMYNSISNGGAEKAVTQLCKAMLDNGCKVTLYLEHSHENDSKLDKRLNIVYIHHSSPYKKDDVKIHSPPLKTI